MLVYEALTRLRAEYRAAGKADLLATTWSRA